MLYRFFTHWRNSYIGIPKEVWLLSFISLINRCGSLVIVFLSLYLTQELKFGIREAGYASMFFGIGSFAGSFTGGRLTDRFGFFSVQFFSLIANGIVLLLLLFVHSFFGICVGIFFMSFTSEAFRPANSVAISTYCTPETRTRSISLYRMAVNMGWAVAPAFGGLLVAIGWPYLFWVDGITCVAAAFLLYWLLPPGKSPTREKLDPTELEPVKNEMSPYHDRQFLWFFLLTTLNAMVFMQFIWTVPVFWKEAFAWPESKVGLISAINGLLVFFIEMPLIFKIEGLRPPLQYIRLGLLLYVLAYLSFLGPFSNLTLGLLFILFISIGEILVMPFSANYVFSKATGKFKGQYMAMYGIAYSLANTIAPLYGTQVIAAWGYGTLWCLLGLQTLLVWGGFWFLEKAYWKPETVPAVS
ncbi:MAG: MFS transporter [Saprospiraceae bacterium]|nr:MFS transporter [Saprospiraceae bacterium]